MPQVINRFITKVLRLVKEFFQAEFYEYGTLSLSASDNDRDIFVPTNGVVLRVWFSMRPEHSPYWDVHGGNCYVSEAHPCPNGFQFRVNLKGVCVINWFAIEEFGGF